MSSGGEEKLKKVRYSARDEDVGAVLGCSHLALKDAEVVGEKSAA